MQAAPYYLKSHLNIGNKTPDELEKIYKEWDYQYKPKFYCFFSDMYGSIVTEERFRGLYATNTRTGILLREPYDS